MMKGQYVSEGMIMAANLPDGGASVIFFPGRSPARQPDLLTTQKAPRRGAFREVTYDFRHPFPLYFPPV